MATGPSFVEYTATGGQTAFGPVTFSGGAALRSSHVKAYVNGTLVSATVSGSLATPTVTLDVAASLNDTVRIQRETPRTAATRIVDFADGSTLTATDLDEANLSALYAAQEIGANIGSAGSGLPLDTSSGHYNANNLKIENVQGPAAGDDAATKDYVDDEIDAERATAVFTAVSASNSAAVTLNSLLSNRQLVRISNGTDVALAMTIASGTYLLNLLVFTSSGAISSMVYCGRIVSSADSVLTVTPPSGGFVQGWIARLS